MAYWYNVTDGNAGFNDEDVAENVRIAERIRSCGTARRHGADGNEAIRLPSIVVVIVITAVCRWDCECDGQVWLTE